MPEHKRDFKGARLWVRFPRIFFFIFSFFNSFEAKSAVKLRHSTRNASRIVESLTSRFPGSGSPHLTLLCLGNNEAKKIIKYLSTNNQTSYTLVYLTLVQFCLV